MAIPQQCLQFYSDHTVSHLFTSRPGTPLICCALVTTTSGVAFQSSIHLHPIDTHAFHADMDAPYLQQPLS